MSLTRYLNQPHIRALFKEHITNPGIHKGLSEIRVLSKTATPGLVGTAFDYYFRLNMEFRHSKMFAEDPRPLEDIIGNFDSYKAHLGTELDENANEAMMKVLKKKADISVMIDHSINYAIMDTFYRSGYPIELKPMDRKAIGDEILALMTIVPFEIFKPKKWVVSGPRFTLAEPLGGADADLIIDSMLIDLKTVSIIKDSRDIINQLYGYWFFSLLNLEQDPTNERSEIDTLAVYFARHGLLRPFDPKEFISPASLNILLNHIKEDIGWENIVVEKVTKKIVSKPKAKKVKKK